MNYALRTSRIRSAVMLGAVALIGAAVVAQPASAGKPVKVSYYTASSSSTTGADPAYVATSGTPVEFTITNCGTSTSAPTDCAGTRGTTIDSVSLTVPDGWSISGTLASSSGAPGQVGTNGISVTGLKVAAGDSVTVDATIDASASGAGTPQVVTVSVADSSGALFTNAGSGPLQLEVPVYFQFSGQPNDVQPPTGDATVDATRIETMCGVAVTVTDAPAGTDSLSTVSPVYLRHSSGSQDPGLSFANGGGSVISADVDSGGVATFSNCLQASTVGGPYSLSAYAIDASGTAIGASAASGDFSVYQVLQNCGGKSCSASVTGAKDTRAESSSTGTPSLGSSAFTLNDGHYTPFTCTGYGDRLNKRPDVVQTTAEGDKTVVITWSKSVTHSYTDTGTPHWEVCMRAPITFKTDSGGYATQPTGDTWFVGTLPVCGTAGLGANDPCVVLSRIAQSQQVATITLPAGWTSADGMTAGDPFFH